MSTTTLTARIEPGTIMGSAVALLCDDARRSEVLDLLRHLESRWSRFLSDSDISLLNGASGRPVAVHPDTIRLLEHLAESWRRTDGDFDPTLLGPLAALGYHSSRTDPGNRTTLPPVVAPRGRPDEVLVDRDRLVAALPAGTVLDPGGLGKGLAADIAAERLIAAGDTGPILVEIGGDLRVAGPAPVGGFTIDVWDPTRHQPLHRIALSTGGVATSSTLLRRWERNGEPRHHLLDPARLVPAANGAVACTVIAGTAAWAETLTKIAFVRPFEEVVARLDGFGVAALVTADDGTEHTTRTWKEFLR